MDVGSVRCFEVRQAENALTVDGVGTRRAPNRESRTGARRISRLGLKSVFQESPAPQTSFQGPVQSGERSLRDSKTPGHNFSGAFKLARAGRCLAAGV